MLIYEIFTLAMMDCSLKQYLTFVRYFKLDSNLKIEFVTHLHLCKQGLGLSCINTVNYLVHFASLLTFFCLAAAVENFSLSLKAYLKIIIAYLNIVQYKLCHTFTNKLFLFLFAAILVLNFSYMPVKLFLSVKFSVTH